MINKYPVSRTHVANRAESLRIINTVPNSTLIAFQIRNGVSFWVCFRQIEFHLISPKGAFPHSNYRRFSR